MREGVRRLASAIIDSPEFEPLLREIKRRGTFQNGQVFVADFVESRSSGYREAMDDLFRIMMEIASDATEESEERLEKDPFSGDDIISARFSRKQP